MTASMKCILWANVSTLSGNLFGVAITRDDENIALAWSVMGLGWAISVALFVLAFRVKP